MTQEELINQLQEFTDIRNQQKQRGLNDYNVMTAIRKAHSEVGMHSNFIYSLLDIEGSHYQGDLFAKLFVEHALIYKDFGKIKEVQMEEDADGRRIDFTIKSDTYYIGIEMKIYAEDQPNQIVDYFKNLTQKAQKDKNQTVEIFYLTLNGNEASKNSCQDTKYNIISFEQHILNWLEASQKEVANITNLNNAIGYYTDVVKQLTNTNKYQSPINRYEDFFLNQEIYECYEQNQDLILKDIKDSDEIEKAFLNTKQKLYDDFYKNLLKPILDTNQDIKFNRYIEDTSSHQIQLKLYDLYHINIFLNTKLNCFKFIGLGIAWSFENKEIRKIHDNNNSKLNTHKQLKFYKVGGYEIFDNGKKIKIKENSGKGQELKGCNNIPEPTIENLFLAQNNQIVPLPQNIIDEIQKKHIDIIINALTT